MAGTLVGPLALLLVVAAFVVALLGAHVDPPGYAPRPAPSAVEIPETQPSTNARPPAHGADRESTSRPLHEVGNLVLWLYAAFVIGCLLALAVLVFRAVADRARRLPRGASEPDERGYDLQPELVAQRMAAAAVAGLDELAAEGRVADAIIACWQRLRAAAEEAGVPPVASDTPEQAIARVLRAGAVSEGAARPLTTLADLYREARFSEHEMSRGDVWVARQALQAIVAELLPVVPGVR